MLVCVDSVLPFLSSMARAYRSAIYSLIAWRANIISLLLVVIPKQDTPGSNENDSGPRVRRLAQQMPAEAPARPRDRGILTIPDDFMPHLHQLGICSII